LAADILKWLHLAVLRYRDPAPAVHNQENTEKILIHPMGLF